MGDNQYIKRKLVESGVIGRVLDDFNPRLGLTLECGDTQIKLGDEVTPAEVQRPPTSLELDSDPLDLELHVTFINPELVALILTDPDSPGGEYLHWCAIIRLKLTLPFLALGHDIVILDSRPMELVAYEPPRSGAHMLVLTLFRAHKFQTIVVPNSRENFSTRTFAHTNAFGSPLGASFFNIKYENEDEKQKNEGSESSTCNGVGPCSKRKENGSMSNTCDGAGPCSKRQKNGSTSNTSISAGSCTKLQHNGSTSNPKQIPESESTSKRRRISVSLGAAFSRINYENEGENRKND